MSNVYKVSGVSRYNEFNKYTIVDHINNSIYNLGLNLKEYPCKVISDIKVDFCEYEKIVISEVKVIMYKQWCLGWIKFKIKKFLL